MQRTVDGSDGLSRSSGLVFFLGTGSGPRTIRWGRVFGVADSGSNEEGDAENEDTSDNREICSQKDLCQ